jgi:GT2 family glycosyltransferase
MNIRRRTPAVSVVIPTYNRAADLRRCLESLAAQTFTDFEVLICDDGSVDETSDVASSFSGRLEVRYENAENFGGPARPRNRGIAAARGQYIAFLDSDDWWTPEKLDRSVAALVSGADVVYHDLYIVRTANQQRFGKRLRSSEPLSPMFHALLCTGMSIPNSSVVTRRTLLQEIGGISENRDLVSIEDYDTWIRLARLTERFARLPDCLGYYWQGGNNISAASPQQQTRILSLYAQYLDALPIDARLDAHAFLDYRIGRIAMMHGDVDSAIPHLRRALVRQADARYQIKALYFLLRCLMAARNK